MSHLPTKKIIAITGTLSAGKGVFSSYLVNKYGFIHKSVRQCIIDHYLPEEKNILDERERLRIAADRVRKQFGPDYLIKTLYKQSKKLKENVVIESVRAPSEARYIIKHGGILFGVDAPLKLRFARAKTRTDLASLFPTIKDMKTKEEKEMHNTDPNKGNISKCLEMAKTFHVFINNGSIEDFHKEIDLVVSKYLNH